MDFPLEYNATLSRVMSCWTWITQQSGKKLGARAFKSSRTLWLKNCTAEGNLGAQEAHPHDTPD